MKAFIFLSAIMAMALANHKEELLSIFNNGNKQFTAKFFSEVVKEQPGKSVVMSAFSVMQPLAQLSLAAVGESHDEILATIGISNDTLTKEVFPFVNFDCCDLKAVQGIELKMANKIYIPSDAELNAEFGALSKIVFDSEVKNIDFLKNTVAAAEINAWVEDHTNHRIKNLVDPNNLGADTRAVLVNALYFKGSWARKFDKGETTDRDFHVAKDKTVKIPTMHKEADHKYGESKVLDAKLLELPYEGEKASMLVILPNQVDGISGLLEKLKDPAVLDNAVQQMFSREVNVFLPKFKIETQIDLKKVLSEVGIKKLFDAGKARLDNLLKDSHHLYVSDAVQKAFIEVNEDGAEAAAANVFFAVSSYSSVTPPPVPEFQADRPFLYILMSEDLQLFTGIFAN